MKRCAVGFATLKCLKNAVGWGAHGGRSPPSGITKVPIGQGAHGGQSPPSGTPQKG